MSWGDLYTLLITVTGWTWEYIDDHMTIPRLDEMTTYWKYQPPIHLMLASFFGIKEKTKEPEMSFEDFVRMFPKGI